MNHERFIVPPGSGVSLKEYDPEYTGEFNSKEDALEKLERDIERLAELQDILYAQDTYALLLVFQAMDASGKDGVIKHVMSGVTPAGCQVYSFKAPSPEELDHDYLWRCYRALPERGRIGIFNRSYYEEVLAVRVHPEYLLGQQLPPEARGPDVWERRFEEINNFERHLTRNGTHILKFFLNVSKAEQKRRFMERIERPEKNWKFSFGDVRERGHWDAYMRAYEEVFRHTSTEHAPWYVIPADHKWFTRAAVADIIVKKLESMPLVYPELSERHRRELAEARRLLEAEEE
ncbi:MAG TPA: polyphosphate kinase 2 family protein [Pyrinomonadaceae bacterium]|nr:polyphosphate kinase 2 family protein [Pyrinomonadaceae bacterium]